MGRSYDEKRDFGRELFRALQRVETDVCPVLSLYIVARRMKCTRVYWKIWVTDCVIELFRWDEWVPAQRLLKYNEQNLALQKQLNATVQAATAASASTAAAVKTSKNGMRDGKFIPGSSRKEGTRGTKRTREDVCRCLYIMSSKALNAVIYIGGWREEA